MASEQFKQWIIASATGVDGLQLTDAPIPKPGDNEVLVKFRSVSLNYRDIVILNVSPLRIQQTASELFNNFLS